MVVSIWFSVRIPGRLCRLAACTRFPGRPGEMTPRICRKFVKILSAPDFSSARTWKSRLLYSFDIYEYKMIDFSYSVGRLKNRCVRWMNISLMHRFLECFSPGN